MKNIRFEYHNRGVTRLVILVWSWAIKIPNFSYSHQHWLNGCYANWSERMYSKRFKHCIDCDYYEKIAPTIFCSWFGLLSIQQRCQPLERHLTEEEMESYRNQTEDIKIQKFGILNGKLVCLDYA